MYHLIIIDTGCIYLVIYPTICRPKKRAETQFRPFLSFLVLPVYVRLIGIAIHKLKVRLGMGDLRTRLGARSRVSCIYLDPGCVHISYIKSMGRAKGKIGRAHV